MRTKSIHDLHDALNTLRQEAGLALVSEAPPALVGGALAAAWAEGEYGAPDEALDWLP